VTAAQLRLCRLGAARADHRHPKLIPMVCSAILPPSRNPNTCQYKDALTDPALTDWCAGIVPGTVIPTIYDPSPAALHPRGSIGSCPCHKNPTLERSSQRRNFTSAGVLRKENTGNYEKRINNYEKTSALLAGAIWMEQCALRLKRRARPKSSLIRRFYDFGKTSQVATVLRRLHV